MSAGNHSVNVNGYEDAVATQLLATNCMACGRDLLDSDSVEAGIGPICREKYGYDVPTGAVDDQLIDKAMAMAPPVMQESLRAAVRDSDYHTIANKAVWHAAMATSYTGPEAQAVIAVAQQLTMGAGYHRLSERIKTFHFRSTIAIERAGTGHICARTPYHGAFVNAVRNIEGRRWDGARKVWCIPEAQLPSLVAALSASFPDQIMQDLEGNLVAIPRNVQFPPPKTKAAGAPTEQTGERDIADLLKGLKKGDIVLDAKGKERKIGWIDHIKGRLGLTQPGTSGFEFMAINTVKLVPEKKAVDDAQKRYASEAKDAANAGAPIPPLPAPTRPVPASAFSYQVEGISWLDQKRSGILADDMGLGKTLQACVAIDAPALIVCPAVVRVEWLRELGKWRPELTALVVTGKKALQPSAYAAVDVVIINYDILGSHLTALLQVKFKTLIADEAHMLKTLKLSRGKYAGSSRAKAFVELSEHIERRFLLTGTPIMNRPIELWPLLHMVDRHRWDSYSGFGKRYCDGRLETKVVKGGRTVSMWNFQGSSNERELNALLTSQYMLRRTKDILDLPEKSRQSKLISLEPDVAKEYDRAAKDFLDWVEEQGGAEAVSKAMSAEAISKMTALRHLCATGKIAYAVDWIKMHAASTGRPLIVMAHHRDVTLGIVERLRVDADGQPVLVETPQGERPLRVGKIIGGMAEAQRTADKDAFQRGDLDVIVCSIQAAGVGLTLTAASETLFVERAWRPSDLVQAEDRCYRIGQKNKVTITYLDAAGTIDEAIATLLISKRSTMARIIDGVDVDDDEAAKLVLGVMFGLGGEKGVKMPARALTGGVRRNARTVEPLLPWMSASEL